MSDVKKVAMLEQTVRNITDALMERNLELAQKTILLTRVKAMVSLIEEKIDQTLQGEGPQPRRLGVALEEARALLLLLKRGNV